MANTTIALKIIAGLWIAWVAYWIVAARDTKATNWREPLTSQALHRAPLWAAIWLLALPDTVPRVLTQSFLPPSTALQVASVLLAITGMTVSVWARRHLGRNWSGTVTVKEAHTLVRTGPYGYVRHPIYSGLLLALLGTALAIDEWRGLVAFLLAFVALILKSRIEEDRMRATFADYDEYRRRTAALVPFVW